MERECSQKEMKRNQRRKEEVKVDVIRGEKRMLRARMKESVFGGTNMRQKKKQNRKTGNGGRKGSERRKNRKTKSRKDEVIGKKI